jgi:uncharacterized protein YodC (DUF2158 family)
MNGNYMQTYHSFSLFSHRLLACRWYHFNATGGGGTRPFVHCLLSDISHCREGGPAIVIKVGYEKCKWIIYSRYLNKLKGALWRIESHWRRPSTADGKWGGWTMRADVMVARIDLPILNVGRGLYEFDNRRVDIRN